MRVYHCIVIQWNVLSICFPGHADKLGVPATKLLHTFHSILQESMQHISSYDVERNIGSISNIQLFVFLFAPLANTIKESDLTFRLARQVYANFVITVNVSHFRIHSTNLCSYQYFCSSISLRLWLYIFMVILCCPVECASPTSQKPSNGFSIYERVSGTELTRNSRKWCLSPDM